jgi:hypothetical protein
MMQFRDRLSCLFTGSGKRELKYSSTLATVEPSCNGISRKLICFRFVWPIFRALIRYIKYKLKDQQMHFGFIDIIFLVCRDDSTVKIMYFWLKLG